MYVIKVKVIQAKIRQRSLGSLLDMFLCVKAVPELAGDEKVLSSYKALLKSCFETVANAFFVAIVSSSLETGVSMVSSFLEYSTQGSAPSKSRTPALMAI